MLPWVRVPVFPTKSSLTIPIFSGASKFLTRILSCLYILMTVKARETPTVSGRPSGVMTTNMTTTIFADFGSLSSNTAIQLLEVPILIIRKIIRQAKTVREEIIAKQVNLFFKFLSFLWIGVLSLTLSFSSLIPLEEFAPTAHTTALHYPLTMREPAFKNGSSLEFFLFPVSYSF